MRLEKKISESNYNGVNSKPILCYDIDRNFIGRFSNARRAGESLNIDYKLISGCATKNRNFVSGKYTFFFEDSSQIDIELTSRIQKTTKIGIPFFMIDKFGNKKIYNNIMDVNRDFGINFKNVWMCLDKQRKTAGGYAYVYESEFDGNFEKFFKKETKGFKIKAKSPKEELDFGSLATAAKYFKMKPSTLRKYIEKNKPKNEFYFSMI